VPEAASHLPPEAFFLCGNESFLALPYPTKCAREGWRLIPGNADLITLLFAVRRPDYDHYWGIEYDVHYEGDWSDFFAHFAASPADLLTTTIHWQRETPAKTLPSPPFRSPSLAEYRQPDRLWAFLAIYRISRRGVAAIDAAYRAGGGGHHELTWPTIIAHAGLVLEDIGGNGAWVRPENVNRFYFNRKSSYSMSPGTFVFRPVLRRVLKRPNTLWHPLKPKGQTPWHLPAIAGNPARLLIEAVKPVVHRLAIRAWFALRWNPLPPAAAATTAGEKGGSERSQSVGRNAETPCGGCRDPVRSA